jgi:predicted PurR-regulated permease PerM
VIAALVASTVSRPVAVATVVFLIALRLVEGYVPVPRIIGRAVHVPALVTVVAVLLGACSWASSEPCLRSPSPRPCR